MSSISFSGLGSGLDVDTIVKALVEAQSAPVTSLENKKTYAEAQISAYGQVTSRLNTLREAMLELRGLEKFQALAANSGNSSLFSATADHQAGAVSGNYTIEVLAEAQNYRQVSSSFAKTEAVAATGSDAKLVFSGLDGTTGDIELDISGKTLDQIRQQINNHADLKGKVSATLVNVDGDNARLVLNSTTTGEEGRFSATFSGAGVAAGLEAVDSADPSLSTQATDNLNARIKIDGIEVSSSTNTFSGVISGVNITLATGAASQSTTTSSLNVARDDESIINSVNAFVKAYNDVIIHINEQKKNGMAGDSTLRTIESELRNVLMTATEGGTVLANYGITTYVEKSYNAEDGASSSNGTLLIDNAKLKEAMNNDFDQFALTWGGSSFYIDGQASGYAERFADLAQRLTSTTVQNGQISKGLLEIRTEGLNSQIKRYDDRITSISDRLVLLEDRLRTQFNAMDTLAAQMNSTQSFLTQQFSNLAGYTKN